MHTAEALTRQYLATQPKQRDPLNALVKFVLWGAVVWLVVGMLVGFIGVWLEDEDEESSYVPPTSTWSLCHGPVKWYEVEDCMANPDKYKDRE